MPQGDNTNGSDNRETPDTAADYIAAMTGQLAKIAKRHGLDTLSTLLEMARIEADQSAKQ
jgi:hypothetical protein